jgi:NAD(P)-dependent dehydrogenase (short-subunit alcohol dehydrogenase family)
VNELAGRVALVTGAASSIGEATAYLLAAHGATVALADIAPGVADVAEAIAARGGQALPLHMDVRETAAIDAGLRDIVARFGGLHLLANVAGIFPQASLGDTDDALLADVIETNLAGTYRTCRAALPLLAAEGGAIVNVASGAAFRGMAGFSAYSASKGGVTALSRALAAEAAPKVRVNTVAPGATASPAVRARAAAAGGRPAGMAETPLGRMAEPEEVAEAILFLLSPRARFITGQALFVNGGSYMH